MVSCRICIDDLKKPVSLPCGHIFCAQCIVKTIQAIRPLSYQHPCPICRAPYMIVPPNLSLIPPPLRPFITPSIRKVYLDMQPPLPSDSTSTHEHVNVSTSNPGSTPAAQSTPPPSSLPNAGPSRVRIPSESPTPCSIPMSTNSSSTAPPSSLMLSQSRNFTTPSHPPQQETSPSNEVNAELARLRTENHALRMQCAMWRKRAEAHGAANLGLINFAKAVRDQASLIARERNELDKRCYFLKRRLDFGDDEDGDAAYQAEILQMKPVYSFDALEREDFVKGLAAKPMFNPPIHNLGMKSSDSRGPPSKKIKLDSTCTSAVAGPPTSRS